MAAPAKRLLNRFWAQLIGKHRSKLSLPAPGSIYTRTEMPSVIAG
jgi:hypothetical protein